MKEPCIRLCAESLWSKFGFEDGDILDALMVQDHVRIRCDTHELLYHLVNKYLLPLLPEKITTTYWLTSHNPCRISEESDEQFPDLQWDTKYIYVKIPISVILTEDAYLWMEKE